MKRLCYKLQQHLLAQGLAVRRSHLYEITSAALGYGSYAALRTAGIAGERNPSHDWDDDPDESGAPDITVEPGAKAATRAAALGHPVTHAAVLGRAVANAVGGRHLEVWSLDAVESMLEPYGLREAFYGADDEQGTAFEPTELPVLINGLRERAEDGDARAAYLLALVHAAPRPPDRAGGYWHRRRLEGMPLTPVQAEFAAIYSDALDRHQEGERLLAAALHLGSADAALLMAERSGTADDYRQAVELGAGTGQPGRLADLAERAGDPVAARALRVAAAGRGDTDAMRTLAEDRDQDPVSAWAWVHVAEAWGVDFTRTWAVDDEGNEADADEGGPIYAAGGIDLEPLPVAQHAAAWQLADQRLAAGALKPPA